MRYLPHINWVSLLVVLLAATACSSTSKVEDNQPSQTANVQSGAASDPEAAANAGSEEEATNEADEPAITAGKIIRKPGKVKDRGVYVKMIVNKNAITNSDITRRAAFLRLRRVNGNRTKLAEAEMIEQILKLQEAKRQRVLASDEVVDKAFANFAKRNRTNPSRLASEMNKLGIGASHFKDFIKTQISWQAAVSRRFQAETTNLTERDAVIQLRDSGSEKPELTEYSFQQVVFVVPKEKRSKAMLAARRSEANSFRQRFTNCGDTIGLAKQLRDVSVIDRKRILQPELPPQWLEEIKATSVNQTTRPKETDKGIELLAICNEKQVADDRAAQVATQSEEFDSFNTKGTELSQKYLETLKSNATIIYQ